MKYYNQNGKPTSVDERRNATQRYRESLFSRVLSPQPPSTSSISAIHRVNVSSKSTLGIRSDNYQQSAVRAVSAHASRRFQSKSAKSRTKSAKERVMFDFPDGGIIDTDDQMSQYGSLSSTTTETSKTQHEAENVTAESSSRSQSESHADDLTINIDNTTGDRREHQQELVIPSQRSHAKQSFGLRIAVADFTKKVADNEGMGISTFSYLDENESEDPLEECRLKSDSLSSMPELPTMSPDQRKVSIRSYQKYRSTLNNLTPGEKFRRAVKTINLLLRACTSRAEETKRVQKRLLTFMDIQEEINDGHSEVSEMLFDLNYYKAKRERTISAEAKEIMRLHPSLRTEEQIQKVVLSLNSAVEAFGEFPINMQESLVRVGWYEKFGPKRVIIRQGHAALNFYFMISGVTLVTVARQNRSTGESYAETVAFLKKGNSFGELALMYGGKRSATVSCKDEVELLAVAREDFVDIFMSLDPNVEPDHIRFLRDIPFFTQWPINVLPYDDPSICLFTYFRRGTVLCRDSNNAEWVYIVMSGTCRIIKDLRCKDPKIQRLKTKDRMLESLVEDKDAKSIRYYSFLHKSLGDTRNADTPRSSVTSKSLKKRAGIVSSNKKIYIQLKNLEPREIFGLESIAFELYGGTNSVTFVSDGAECVLINRNFFLKHMTDSYLKMLRKELQPFPSADALEEKLQASSNWNAYREYLVEHLVGRKQYIDSMLY